MISLNEVARLTVSAASGCAVRDGVVWVVADDDLGLHGYSLQGEPRAHVPLLPGALSDDFKTRKAQKPDFEALAVLPDRSLLAVPSGSSPARRRAAHIALDGTVKVVDCGALFDALAREFELNLEGAVVRGDVLVLAQRGNGARAENALVEVPLDAVLAGLTHGELASEVRAIHRVALGALRGCQLSLTDLALDAKGRLLFSAAAEDTTDPYLDGECIGSVVGGFDGHRVAWFDEVAPVVKIEGLAHLEGERFVLVSDADDPKVKAPLFTATISAPP